MATTTELTLLERLVTTAKAFRDGHHLTTNEASLNLFDDPRRLGKLNRSQNPCDLTPQDYATTMALMSRFWPRNTDWPEGIDRPSL